MTKSNNNQEEMGSQNISCDRIRIDNLLNDEDRIAIDELINHPPLEVVSVSNFQNITTPDAKFVNGSSYKEALMKNITKPNR